MKHFGEYTHILELPLPTKNASNENEGISQFSFKYWVSLIFQVQDHYNFKDLLFFWKQILSQVYTTSKPN